VEVGLKCDAGLAIDAARVLRVPGTLNKKAAHPRPVKLAHLGVDYDFGVDLARLATIAPTETPLVTAAVRNGQALVPFDLSAFVGKRMHPLLAAKLPLPQYDSLAEGINRHNDLPLNPDEVFKGCPHFADCALNHGKGHGQGLWMLTMLASTWFEDGRSWAHYFSKGYPTYTRDETDAMYDRKLKERETRSLGWPSCTAFENAGCTMCATCIHKGKIKSPLNLGTWVAAPDLGTVVQVEEASTIAIPDADGVYHQAPDRSTLQFFANSPILDSDQHRPILRREVARSAFPEFESYQAASASL
jgi:hypothetical protein